MVVEYTNTLEDIRAFSSYHYKNSPTIRRQRLSAQLTMTFLFAAAYIITVTLLAGARATASLILYGSIGIGGAIVVFFASQKRVESRLVRNIEKLYGEGKNTSLFELRSVIIDAEGVKYKSPSSEGNIKWSAIEKVVTTDTHLFVYTSAMSAIAVPKRALSNEVEWNDLVKLVQNYQQAAAVQ